MDVSDDDELPPAHQIMASMAKPVSKVAGSRRPPSEKAKGKQRAVEKPAASGSGTKRKATAPHTVPDASKKPKGRAAGAANYSAEDVDTLLDILEERLPLGGHAWNSATDEFNAWAQTNDRPVRSSKSLEVKYKQVHFFPHFP